MPEFHQVRALFDQLTECGGKERDALRDQLCGTDTRLREEIDALLRVHDGQFLAGIDRDALDPGEKPALALPCDLGSFRLLEVLGEGGGGSVYLAEQRHPVRRRVAVKVLWPGPDTEAILRQSEAERQTLALMDHPNIARFWDAGTTPDGHPFFAMELVEGVPITEWCRQKRSPLAERLRLFAQTCRAVQHSHHKGIIHRDLKPSNILVSKAEGTAAVKIIDFGIAAAVHSSHNFSGDASPPPPLPPTPFGTPAYMSPEQTDPAAGGADARSDVFSLGAVFYELLTGTTPIPSERLKSSSPEEFRRILLEERPAPPSARARSGSPSPVPAADLRGDLDAIALKALARNPEQRYSTAIALAEDVELSLSHRPVRARGGSFRSHAGKFLRRHRLGSALALCAILLVLGSLVFALRAWSAARKEAESRRVQADRAETVSRMLTRLLDSTNPIATSVGKQPGGYSVRAMLADFDRELKASTHLEPAAELALRQTFGRAWQAQGEYDEAEKQLRLSLALALGEGGETSPVAASIRHDLGAVLQDRGRYHDARAMLLLALSRRIGADALATEAVLAECSKCLGDMDTAESLAHRIIGAPDADIRSLQRAAEVLTELGEHEAAATAAERALASARLIDGDTGARAFFPLYTLASVRRHQGDAAASELLAREALALAEERLGGNHPLTAFARSQAVLLSAASIGEIQQAAADLEAAVSSDHPEALDLMYQAVTKLLEAGDDNAALDLLFKIVGVDRKERDRGKYVHTEDFSPAFRRILESGRSADFQKISRDAWQRARARRGPTHRVTISLQKLLYFNLLAAGDLAEAETLLADICQRCDEGFGPGHFRSVEARIFMQKLQGELKRPDKVREIGLDIESRMVANTGDPDVLGYQLLVAGVSLMHCHYLEDAERLLSQSAAMLRTADPAAAAESLVSCLGVLADLLDKTGRLPKALEAIREAQAVFDRHLTAAFRRYPELTRLHARILTANGQGTEARLVLERAISNLEAMEPEPENLAELRAALAEFPPDSPVP